MEGEVLSEDRLSEHSYSKHTVSKGNEASPTGGSPIVATLSETDDTFETLLLCLLRTFTRNQREASGDGTATASSPVVDPATDISPAALTSLSSEQLQALQTSNAVNYDVLQQVIRQRERSRDPSPRGPSPEAASPGDAQSDEQPTPSILQITPEQLGVIQQQVTDIIRSQRVTLPADLSPEQQQQLIQTLVLRQIHLHQSAMAAKRTEEEETESGGGGRDAGTGTIADLLRGKKEEETSVSAMSGEGEAETVGGENDRDGASAPRSSEELVGGRRKSAIKEEAVDEREDTATVTSQGTSTEADVAIVSGGAGVEGPSPGTQTDGTRGGDETSQVADSASTPSQLLPIVVPSTKPSLRRRREASHTRKEEPKKPPLPYNLFFSEVYSTVHAANTQMSFAEASKIISMMWNAMGVEAKKPYMEKYDQLKKEYKEAMDRWKTPSEGTQEEEQPAQASNSGGVAQARKGVSLRSGGAATTRGGISVDSGGVARDSGGVAKETVGVATTNPIHPEETSRGVKATIQQPSLGREGVALGKRLTAELESERDTTPTKKMKREISVEDLTAKTNFSGEKRTVSTAHPKAVEPKIEHVPYIAGKWLKDSKLCANDGCSQPASFDENRGHGYCSNECVVGHCRNAFQWWVSQKKIAT